MNMLFSPMKIGCTTLPNRIVIPPMCQYSAKEGVATHWHTAHYNSMALSGAGLLIIEATAVVPEGRISPADLGLWDDKTEAALTTLIAGIRENSAMPIAIQLAHAGRKASTNVPWEGTGKVEGDEGWQTYAPSAIAFSDHFTQPQALTEQQITNIIDAFVLSAKRAERAGFDGVEVHAAHGYLLHEFLSPLTNLRTDRYGGSFENRISLILEIVKRVRQSINPTMFVAVRLSATDWVDGGWDIEQSIKLSQQLKEIGCDVIDVSSGGLSAEQQIVLKANYQVPFAEAIKKEVDLPVIAVGLITEPVQAENILREQKADLVAIGRGILFDPHWPWRAAIALGEKLIAPPQYFRSLPHGIDNIFSNQ